MKKKSHLKKIIFFLVTISLFLTSCSNNSEKNISQINKYYKVEEVKKQDISLDESYISYAKWIKEIPVSTKVSWRITYLSKKNWDNVKAWELIAQVTSDESQNWLKTANSIILSLESLKSSTALSFDEEIKSVKTKINQINLGAELSEIWVSGANSGIKSTKEITKKQINTLDWQIKQAETWVKQAESQVEISKNRAKQAVSWIEIAKSELESIKTAYKELNKTLEIKEKIIYDNSFEAITNSVILYTNIFDFIDRLMWYSDLTKDNAKKIKDYLSAKNKKYLNLTEKNYKNAKILFLEYKNIYASKIENWKATKKELKEILEKWQKISLQLKILLKNTYNVVDYSIENVNLPLSQLNFYKSEISNMWVKLDMPWTLSLKWNLQSILSFEAEKSRQLEDIKSKLRTAQKWLQAAENNALVAKSWILSAQNAVLTAKSGVFTSEKNLEQYKEIWKWKIIWIENEKLLASKQKELTLDKKNEILKMINSLKAKKIAALKEIDTKIAEAKWKLNESNIMIENAKVFSPVSWIVTNKMAEIGQVIWAWFPIYTINDNSQIKLEVEVSDDIVKNIKLKEKINVEFEWINKKFIWIINNIPNTKNKLTKKTSIEILIPNKKSEIKIGSLAKVYFKNKKNNWLVIPSSAIIEKFMLPWVYVIKDKKIEFRKIKIIGNNWDLTQVSWLKQWEKIISKWKENFYDWEILR